MDYEPRLRKGLICDALIFSVEGRNQIIRDTVAP